MTFGLVWLDLAATLYLQLYAIVQVCPLWQLMA